MDYPKLKHGSSGDRPAMHRSRKSRRVFRIFRFESVKGHIPELVVCQAKHVCLVSMAKSCSRFDQRVKDRLQLEGRAADNLEDLGSRRLLLQRFAEIAG